jgi:hypothetical protein
MRYQNTHIFFYCCMAFCLFAVRAKSQTVSSPYSILGIGDIETKDLGKYSAEGSTSLSRRDMSSYNFSNPASLSELPYKVMNFDIDMRGRASSFQQPSIDSTTAISKDFAIKRISMAFKVGQKTGIAFGLRPFSSVNYQYITSQAILNGNQFLFSAVDGRGGINQVYFSLGKYLGKKRNPDSSNVSIGFTASYLFGSLVKETQYVGSSLPVNIFKQEANFLSGANLLGGIQVYTKKEKRKMWFHHAGLTVSLCSQLNGQLTTDYTTTSLSSASTTAPIQETASYTQFRMPLTVGFGYSATTHDTVTNAEKFTFSFDVNYYRWPFQLVDYSNSYTTSVFRVSAGIEYAPSPKYYFGLGGSAENSYIMLNNNYLKDYSLTFGAGCNLSGIFSVYGAIEPGVRGNLNDGQIKENYTSFQLGLTLRSVWFSARKFGRFN